MRKSVLLLMLLAGLTLTGCSRDDSDDGLLLAGQARSEQSTPQGDEDPIAEQTPTDPEPEPEPEPEDITPLAIADSSVYFQSGLNAATSATSSSQTLTGQLGDPDTTASGFNGLARINLNGQILTLSPYWTGSAWRFEAPLELLAGFNSLSLTVHDSLGRLRSYNGPREFFSAAANLAEAARFQVTIQAISLDSYPRVGLNIGVSQNGQPVSDLNQLNFRVINAGRTVSPTGFVNRGNGDYSLDYDDVLAGSRRIHVYAARPSANADPTAAGLSAPESYGRNFALLVGINDYPPQFNDLNNCVNDVSDMQALLESSSWGTGQIIRLTDGAATRTAILAQLASFMTQLAPSDALLFHFSGHGSGDPADGESSQYLCTSETEAQWISVSDLSSVLDTSLKNLAPGIANIFVMLDSCHSGNFIAKTLDPERLAKYLPLPDNLVKRGDELSFTRDLSSISGGNIFVMTACRGDQVAYDVGSLSNGAFSHYLTKSLGLVHAYRTAGYPAGAPANLDRDGLASGEEAYTWLLPWVSAYNQTPQLSDNSALNPASLIMLF